MPRFAACIAAAGLLAVALAARAAAPSATFGPFEIETVEKSIGAGGFPNTSANPFARTKVNVFRVKHRGKRVAVRDGDHSNDEFLEAKVLEGAPRPALLLASTGVYLVTEESGQVRVQILASSTTDMASWQWLDGEGGQPAPERRVGIRHVGDEPRVERGGSLLLVNRRTLLNVPTLAASPMIAFTTENVNRADRYNASGEPARALSPARTQHVLVGNKNVDGKFEYALVVMRHDTGEAYAVPFDRNALRFESVADATPDWIARYFDWRPEAGGVEKLAPRKDAKPAPWVGRFVRFGGGMVDYRLEPTDEAMLGVLHEFVVREFGAQANTAARLPEGTDSKAILVEGRTLRLYRVAKERKTSLYAEGEPGMKPAYELVEKIGKRFNEELARGRHQEHFTAYTQ